MADFSKVMIAKIAWSEAYSGGTVYGRHGYLKEKSKKRHFVAIYDDFVLFPKPLTVIFSYFCEKAESSVLRAPAYWDAVLAY